MIQLKDTSVENTAALIAKAVRTAEYYGFVPLEAALARGRRTLPVQHKKEEVLFARHDESRSCKARKSRLP